MSESLSEGTPEWALAYMEDAARHTLLDEGSGTKELRKAVKIIATALAESEARGRRQGLEEAAKVVEAHHDGFLKFSPECEDEAKALSMAWLGIHRLATAPVETQKPEETA